jgi:hypothetical protein
MIHLLLGYMVTPLLVHMKNLSEILDLNLNIYQVPHDGAIEETPFSPFLRAARGK